MTGPSVTQGKVCGKGQFQIQTHRIASDLKVRFRFRRKRCLTFRTSLGWPVQTAVKLAKGYEDISHWSVDFSSLACLSVSLLLLLILFPWLHYAIFVSIKDLTVTFSCFPPGHVCRRTKHCARFDVTVPFFFPVQVFTDGRPTDRQKPFCSRFTC